MGTTCSRRRQRPFLRIASIAYACHSDALVRGHRLSLPLRHTSVMPGSQKMFGSLKHCRTFPDGCKLEFLRPRPPLDRMLPPHGFCAGGGFFAVDQFDRATRPGVSGPMPGVMDFDPRGHIHRPAGVERPIGAAEEVDERHGACAAYSVWRTSYFTTFTEYAICSTKHVTSAR